jgi:opacity protein-like surface antigen
METTMGSKWMSRVLLLVGAAGLAALGNTAAFSQTDVAGSLYGAFNGTTNGDGTTQSPANAAGALLEVRHISNPLIGYEGTYSYNRANEVYSAAPSGCPVSLGTCPITFATVSANAHELAADWIASVKFTNLRPFALAGAGILFDVPAGSQSNSTTSESNTTSTSTKPVFVYGAGLDWGLLPHLGLRFQFRGNLYKAPNLVNLFTSTGAFTHTSEPMIGVFFRL